jgi:transposase InsO family protein
MTIDMHDEKITSVAQLAGLIDAAEGLGPAGLARRGSLEDTRGWMEGTLRRLRYEALGKRDRGTVRRYLQLYSGYAATHVDHLIAAFRRGGGLKPKRRTQPKFPRKYSSDDVAMLAEVSEAYGHQNGRALKEAMRGMRDSYGDARFARLGGISVSRLYELRKTEAFRAVALTYTKTAATQVPIGERRKPYPDGRPGFLRVDSVHQGDFGGEKGVYHVNIVDEVTQDELVVCVEGISERFLAPALEEALRSFPYRVINFHSDNGSEYINRVTAQILDRMLVSQTKSRSRRTNDNALVEGKNASVVRFHMGRLHIPRRHAEAVNAFYVAHLNPFIRFHRFCAFPDEEVDGRGRATKVYRTYMTPCQRLLAIPGVEAYLKEGVTRESLEAEAAAKTHLAAAQEMQKAKRELFTTIHPLTML